MPRQHKPAALGRVLDIESPGGALVFCRTRTEVDQLTETMNARGYRAEALHGGMDQAQRDRVMNRLRDGTAELLVATDVAARGLDVDTLTHVVNYDVPSAPESYVHRIGRVGRAGREGVAITLAEPREQRLLQNIERLTSRPSPSRRCPRSPTCAPRSSSRRSPPSASRSAADDLDDFYPVLHTLRGEADPRTVALAAIRLYHEAAGNTVDEPEIPDVQPCAPSAGSSREQRPQPQVRAAPAHKGGTGVHLHRRSAASAGIRPNDLVGAIANETDLIGREIGPISITEKFSVVGVPETAARPACIERCSSTTIKGKAPASRYTDELRTGPRGRHGQRPTGYEGKKLRERSYAKEAVRQEASEPARDGRWR